MGWQRRLMARDPRKELNANLCILQATASRCPREKKGRLHEGSPIKAFSPQDQIFIKSRDGP